MSNRRKNLMDIRAILIQMRQGASDRRISRNLNIHRQTVKSYRQWAEAQGLLTGELPPIEALQRLAKETLTTSPPPQNRSSVAPYRELVEKLRDEGVEIAAIWQRLQERGFSGGYAEVWRFVRNLEPTTPEATVRVETRPGEEAQVDRILGQMQPGPGQLIGREQARVRGQAHHAHGRVIPGRAVELTAAPALTIALQPRARGRGQHQQGQQQGEDRTEIEGEHDWA